MNHYPHNRWHPAIAAAAVVASAVTLAFTIVLPASVNVDASFDTPKLAREANAAPIPVSLGRIEVVAQRPASVVKASNVTPTAMDASKECPTQRGNPA